MLKEQLNEKVIHIIKLNKAQRNISVLYAVYR